LLSAQSGWLGLDPAILLIEAIEAQPRFVIGIAGSSPAMMAVGAVLPPKFAVDRAEAAEHGAPRPIAPRRSMRARRADPGPWVNQQKKRTRSEESGGSKRAQE
jgi:hypothetical protein